MTYGLKTECSGLEISTDYKRFIFQLQWLIATLIYIESHFKY